MKKLTLILLLIPILSFGQTWKFSEGGSAFDGKYKTSSITGTGTNFPYTSPTLVVNKFDGEDLNFYISNGGFFQEKTGISVLWVFDNEPNTVYSTYDWSISSDGKILFFREFNNAKGSGKLKPIDFIEKLMLANRVSVRMKDKYGANDIIFSLSGSTKAINLVLPKDERDELIALAKKSREVAKAESDEKEKKQLEKQQILNLLMVKANDEKLSNSSLSTIKTTIERDLGIGYYDGMGTGKKYRSIIVEGKIGDAMFEKYGYVSVFYLLEDGSREKVSGTFEVEMDAPVFVRIAEIQEREKEYVENLLSKLSLEKLKNHYKKEILNRVKRSYNPKFNLEDIVDVNITFSNFQYKKVWDSEVTLFLNNMQKDLFNSSIYSLEISKKDLKDIGIQLDVPFKL